MKTPATILIVDDDPIILDILEKLIPLFGYEPVVATSGRAALAIAEQHGCINLLITDIMMPGMNGIDLAKRFQNLYPSSPVLFMSGYGPPP